MVTKPELNTFIIFIINIHSYVPYMSCAGSFAAMLGGLYPPSVAVSVGARVGGDSLTAVDYLVLSHRSVPIATDGVVPIIAIPAVAVVAVSYSVIYQGSVLVLAELADQLGFQR